MSDLKYNIMTLDTIISMFERERQDVKTNIELAEEMTKDQIIENILKEKSLKHRKFIEDLKELREEQFK